MKKIITGISCLGNFFFFFAYVKLHSIALFSKYILVHEALPTGADAVGAAGDPYEFPTGAAGDPYAGGDGAE